MPLLKEWKMFRRIPIAIMFISVIVGSTGAGAAPEDKPRLEPLPPVAVPVDNPQSVEKIELGKMLYFDSRLSGDSSIACAKCHVPEPPCVGWHAYPSR